MIRVLLSVVSPHEANKEEFELSSMRCGRKLTKDGDVSRIVSLLLVLPYCVCVCVCVNLILFSSQYCWRWTGFNFGFDLLVTYTNRFIVFKRNTLSQPCGGAVSLQPRRHLAYRSVLRSTCAEHTVGAELCLYHRQPDKNKASVMASIKGTVHATIKTTFFLWPVVIFIRLDCFGDIGC